MDVRAAPADSPLATNAPVARDHFVQFYERDAALVDEVARYLRGGLESGAAAIMIATELHGASVAERWQSQGFDSGPFGERGQLVVLDAAQTLEKFMAGAWPDPARFDEVIGSLIRDRLERFGEVVAFGEMVALLWADDRRGAAVQLEGLWNSLAARHRFALYCAYPMGECANAEFSEAFRHVCHAHSHVIPAEGFRDGGEAEKLKYIAQLQQRAASLESEVEVRRQVEAKLAARERELSDFLENAIVGMHRVGADGTILWANRAELQMLGYEPHEYIGRNIVDFHADRQLIDRILASLCNGQTLHDQAAKLLRKDGTVRHVLINSNAQMEDGKLVSTRCFTRDVTDRWQAQEALRDRGAVLHLAMQGARMGYWVADLVDGHIRCSHELAALFGLPGAADLSLETFLALVHPDDREGFRAAMSHAITGSTRLACEFRVRPEMGDWRWFEGRGEAIYDSAGEPLRFYGVCMDITKRRREQDLLSYLAAVVDSADDAIVSKTLDGIVTSWNGGASRLFGYSAEEMIGRPVTVLIPPELHLEEAGILARIRSGERIEHYRTSRLAKDGTRKRVSLSVSPVRDLSGRIVGASKIAREIHSD